jgi:aminopeptidase N
MRSEQAKPVKLSDYRVADHVVTTVHLDIGLHPTATRVTATLDVAPHPQGVAGAPLVFDGDGLTLSAITIDGRTPAPEAYEATAERLVIHRPPAGPFRLTLETVVDPQANTQLMGLYRSSGTWCTQCEAEGFRRITYFLDRPDVLAVYTTRIEADRSERAGAARQRQPRRRGDARRRAAPLRRLERSPSEAKLPLRARRRRSRGGVLVLRDASGRRVDLNIYVEPGKEERAHWAMDALKRSMRWDEQRFGRSTISTYSTSSPCRTSTWARWRTRASTSSTTNLSSPRPRRRPMRSSRRSRPSSHTNTSTTGPATASPAVTGSSSA